MVQVMGMDMEQAFAMVQRHQPNHMAGHHCFKLVVDRLSALSLQREEDQQLKDSVNSDRRGGGGCAAPGLAPQGLVHASISGESVFLLGASRVCCSGGLSWQRGCRVQVALMSCSAVCKQPRMVP